VSAALALALAAAAAPAPPAEQGADAFRAELRAADEAFSRACVARDLAAFAALVAEDARFATQRGAQDGRRAVVERWTPLCSPEGPTMSWAPSRAEGAASRDLGVTVGAWTLRPRAAGEKGASGEYVSVWRRDPDRRLRVLIDLPLLPAREKLLRWPVFRATSRAGDLAAEFGELLASSTEPVGYYVQVRRREGKDWATVVASEVPLERAATKP
jgi:ketosteroid isomerase-like protein